MSLLAVLKKRKSAEISRMTMGDLNFRNGMTMMRLSYVPFSDPYEIEPKKELRLLL